MNLAGLQEMARHGRLYPSLILYGASLEERRQAALELGRTLLCAAPASERPCGECRHCRRLGWPEEAAERFHPDFHVLLRDLRTATSADATKSFLRPAYTSPFEARGQVFVVDEAESLSHEAADALLKLLEEPPLGSPRHFLLLAATKNDLLPTLRSRSLAVFLGAAESLDEAEVARVAEVFGRSAREFLGGRSPVYLLTAADALATGGDFKDLRARRPWATAAAAVLRFLAGEELAPPARRAFLGLAEALLDAPRLRLRAVPPQRILEGLLARHLSDLA